MKVRINGKPKEIETSLSVADFLQSSGIKAGEVVVQYNGDILEKGIWSQIVLKENDELEVLRFVGGG